MIGPKPWDRIDLNLLKPNIETVAVMAVGCFKFINICFKSCICMGNAGNGLWIGPKTWDRNCRNSLETLGAVCDSLEFQWVWFGLTCVLNGCLVCTGPGMAVDFGFTK